jgi:hypothetical protein
VGPRAIAGVLEQRLTPSLSDLPSAVAANVKQVMTIILAVLVFNLTITVRPSLSNPSLRLV